MIEEFSNVRIKKTNEVGVVVDIQDLGGKRNYIVECDKGAADGYGPDGCLVDCEEEDLVPL